MRNSYLEYQRKTIIDTVSKTKDATLLNEMYTTLMTLTLERERLQDSEQDRDALG